MDECRDFGQKNNKKFVLMNKNTNNDPIWGFTHSVTRVKYSKKYRTPSLEQNQIKNHKKKITKTIKKKSKNH